MGYTTEFSGRFELDRPLDDETFEYLTKFSRTRRMARNLGPEYGVEGEFYVDGGGEYGQAHEASIINYNVPPRTQPGLWCQWVPTEDRLGIEWDGVEKFYYYEEWLRYIVDNFLKPRGYVLNGQVSWQGEDYGDTGILHAADNRVFSRIMPDNREVCENCGSEMEGGDCEYCEGENYDPEQELENFMEFIATEYGSGNY